MSVRMKREYTHTHTHAVLSQRKPITSRFKFKCLTYVHGSGDPKSTEHSRLSDISGGRVSMSVQVKVTTSSAMLLLHSIDSVCVCVCVYIDVCVCVCVCYHHHPQ